MPDGEEGVHGALNWMAAGETPGNMLLAAGDGVSVDNNGMELDACRGEVVTGVEGNGFGGVVAVKGMRLGGWGRGRVGRGRSRGGVMM